MTTSVPVPASLTFGRIGRFWFSWVSDSFKELNAIYAGLTKFHGRNPGNGSTLLIHQEDV
jgi:hypothetical protein